MVAVIDDMVIAASFEIRLNILHVYDIKFLDLIFFGYHLKLKQIKVIHDTAMLSFLVIIHFKT